MTEMERIDVSVIIVSYNTRHLTCASVASVIAMTRAVRFEVVVVDNASQDGSVVALREAFPEITIIETGANLGFGNACNHGIARAQGKYLFFLNPDTLLLNDAISTLYDWMERHGGEREAGAIGSWLEDSEGGICHSYLDFPDMLWLIGDEFPVIRRRREFRSQPDHAKEREVDYITGADLFVPRAVMDRLGGFDPAYFMYYEESDLQKRMSMLGFRRFIIPGPRICHLEGASSDSPTRRILKYRSRFIYLRHHYKPFAVFLYKIFFVTVRALKAGLSFVQGRTDIDFSWSYMRL